MKSRLFAGFFYYFFNLTLKMVYAILNKIKH